MPTVASSPAREGMYSTLIDDEGACDDLHRCSPDVGRAAHQVPVRPAPRPGPRPYRLAIIGLATLCGVLLISIIAVTAHYKNRPQSGADGGGAPTSAKQTQDKDELALNATISKLQEEKEALLVRLAAETATKAPEATPPTSEAPVDCPVDWHLFNNSCYFISRLIRDWPESQSYCQSKGAHLAVIHTAEEQTFLWDLLPRGHWNAFWFGITDEHTEDQWKWVDGTPLVRGFWEEGEPNNHVDEDCGYIVKTRVLERVATRSWYDAPCDLYWPFICEKEMGGASTATPH